MSRRRRTGQPPVGLARRLLAALTGRKLPKRPPVRFENRFGSAPIAPYLPVVYPSDPPSAKPGIEHGGTLISPLPDRDPDRDLDQVPAREEQAGSDQAKQQQPGVVRPLPYRPTTPRIAHYDPYTPTPTTPEEREALRSKVVARRLVPAEDIAPIPFPTVGGPAIAPAVTGQPPPSAARTEADTALQHVLAAPSGPPASVLSQVLAALLEL